MRLGHLGGWDVRKLPLTTAEVSEGGATIDQGEWVDVREIRWLRIREAENLLGHGQGLDLRRVLVLLVARCAPRRGGGLVVADGTPAWPLERQAAVAGACRMADEARKSRVPRVGERIGRGGRRPLIVRSCWLGA